ncbi:MAG: thioredoxin family protein [Actinomycetota bacterium]|nr:thioredoxin family protein [Actinomycetota bacterium]
MLIKLLGSSGCSSCQKLEALVSEAMVDLGIDAQIVKVIEPAEIMSFGIMSVPGLVVDDRIVAAGRVPSRDELRQILRAASVA